jgi:hypothetical protein
MQCNIMQNAGTCRRFHVKLKTMKTMRTCGRGVGEMWERWIDVCKTWQNMGKKKN